MTIEEYRDLILRKLNNAKEAQYRASHGNMWHDGITQGLAEAVKIIRKISIDGESPDFRDRRGE